MRYTCETCGKWVKDKFIFGTLHRCLSEDDIAYLEYLRRGQNEVPDHGNILANLLRAAQSTKEE